MIMKITIGAPNSDVTAEILSSMGANITLAKRSLNIQNIAPARNAAGIRIIGFEDLSDCLIKNGTAIPIKETGPAKAVTHAAKRLDNIMINILHALTLTPTLFAYVSPSLNASRLLLSVIVRINATKTTTTEYLTPAIFAPEKLPCDHP
jgi:hypothetical protein